MKRSFTYLIGIPGSGKSAAMAQALKHRPATQHEQPFPHIDHGGLLCQIGALRPVFPGTDALAMDAIVRVEPWLQRTHYWTICAEGDRLANDRFFHAIVAAGFELRVVLLDTPPELAEQRRAERGMDQRESWIKGRCAKVLALAQRWTFPSEYNIIDGTLPLESIGHRLAFLIEPEGVTIP